jgi:SAM-dependent methyltransferase
MKKIPDHQLDEIMPILMGAWRRLHKEAGPSDKLQTREFRRVVEAVKTLQEDTLAGKDYFSDKELLGAYLLYQWVVHYQQGLSILGEIPIEPRRVLDVCSGPGAFALAALKHGASEVTATDQNQAALQLGAEVCGRSGYALKIRPWNCLKSAVPIEGKFDLIILGHCLTELFPASESHWQVKQMEFLSQLMNRLTPRGYLVIVDSSYLEANRRILQLRDRMVEKGIPVQAPCVWRGECPALQAKNSPCYAQREFYKPFLIKEIQRSAGINLGSLKMSYIIFRNRDAGWPQLDDKKYYRVISPPVEAYHGTRFYLCGVDGKKNLGTNLTTIPRDARAFEYLKRGELISIENAHEHQNSLDIIEGTQLKVAAACGKPIVDEEDASSWETSDDGKGN